MTIPPPTRPVDRTVLESRDAQLRQQLRLCIVVAVVLIVATIGTLLSLDPSSLQNSGVIGQTALSPARGAG